MGGTRALSLSSLCAASLAAARSPLLSAHQRRPRLAAAMSSSSSPAPAPGADPAAPAATSASSAIDFLTLCYRLKTTKRAGWVRRGLQGPESVADHMYRMGVMALVAADLPAGVNRDRCVKMAIVHDIAEAIVGDITPADGVPKEEKNRREKEALDHMCALLGGGSRADEIRELWMEYEDNATLEAKVVKDFDKVEMILQALEYEKVLDFFRARAGPRRVLPINGRKISNRRWKSMGSRGRIKKKVKLTDQMTTHKSSRCFFFRTQLSAPNLCRISPSEPFLALRFTGNSQRLKLQACQL